MQEGRRVTKQEGEQHWRGGRDGKWKAMGPLSGQRPGKATEDKVKFSVLEKLANGGRQECNTNKI